MVAKLEVVVLGSYLLREPLGGKWTTSLCHLVTLAYSFDSVLSI